MQCHQIPFGHSDCSIGSGLFNFLTEFPLNLMTIPASVSFYYVYDGASRAPKSTPHDLNVKLVWHRYVFVQTSPYTDYRAS